MLLFPETHKHCKPWEIQTAINIHQKYKCIGLMGARENVDIIQLWDLLWRGDQFALFWISIGRVGRVTWSWAFFWNIYKLPFWDLEVFLGPIALIAAEKIYWKDEVLVDCAAKNSKECHNFISKWNEDYGRLSPYLMYKCQTVLCEISG